MSVNGAIIGGVEEGKEMSIIIKECVEMGKKGMFFALLIGVILIGLYGCVGKGKQAEKKEKASASIESTAVSTQEWKTYVSKYGFSISYPGEWKIERATNAKSMEEGEREDLGGYTTFSIYDPSPLGRGIVIDSVGQSDVMKDLKNSGKVAPSDPVERVWYFAKMANSIGSGKDAIKVSDLKAKQVEGGVLYLVGYDDNKYRATRVMFYIEKTDAFCDLSISCPAKQEKAKDEINKIVENIRILR